MLTASKGSLIAVDLIDLIAVDNRHITMGIWN